MRSRQTWWGPAAGVVAVLLVLVAWLVVARGGNDEAARPPSSTSSSSSGSSTSHTTTSSTTSTTSTTTTTSVPTSVTTAPPADGPAVVVRLGPTERRLVALTFDAGSDEGYASEILRILAAERVPATFGVTGRFAEEHPDLLRAIVAGGHGLLNHTYDHRSFTGASTDSAPLTRAARIDELVRADAAIQATGVGSTVPYFRPPYGDEDASVREDVALAGYRYEVMWSVDSLGWKGLPAAEVLQRCLDGAEPGAIYLMHVGSASTDVEALPGLIDGLRARGYGFATISHLLGT